MAGDLTRTVDNQSNVDKIDKEFGNEAPNSQKANPTAGDGNTADNQGVQQEHNSTSLQQQTDQKLYQIPAIQDSKGQTQEGIVIQQPDTPKDSSANTFGIIGFIFLLALVGGAVGWFFIKRNKEKCVRREERSFSVNDRKALELMNSLGKIIKKT